MLHKAKELFNNVAQDNEILASFKYHSLRVMHMSCNLAKKNGCLDTDMQVASLLHDIGKIGLSRQILLKPTKLTDLEYQIIQSHSHIGNTIVRKQLNMPRAAGFIRDHHERWDGNGYPRGLKGDDISLQGRIISICDAFDTMTIDRRSYNKTPLTYEEALEELVKSSWNQFDGNLVEQFIAIIQSFELPEARSWWQDEKMMESLFPV
ncbi:HD-GYP domain-containing protein [Salirhabdus salicampi]|uniref:HD-GYP domain-containing protein n=1 Tax=Salirhabdus salicampi TaxID=476102 RepID=UPI0020C5070C|nr:HD domain-containing phosphohydrolase [Salirhabdus salicampi]MCP8617181.1 HD domain-containing protein [Salirhabdus salicampi]